MANGSERRAEPRAYLTMVFLVLGLSWLQKESDAGGFTLKDVAPEDYDYLELPQNASGPLLVDISIKKMSIRSIDESDMSFSVAIELWQSWSDSRLGSPSWSGGPFHVLDSSWSGKLWNPKLYFMNAVDGKLDNIISPSSFFWLGRTGKIFYCSRVILKLICEMDLKFFPHDKQSCGIQMASAIYSEKQVNLSWNERSADPEVSKLQQFEIEEMKKIRFSTPWGSGNRTCLEFQVILHRRAGYYIINVYIPTILIVIMSMLTFWIPVEAVPARVTLGVTSLLTIITKQYQASMPNVSYIVALNVWISCCIGFVFFSLLEFATVIALDNKATQVDTYPLQPTMPLVVLHNNGTWKTKSDKVPHFQTRKEAPPKRSVSRKIDLFSRIAFPSSFVIFCMVYWWHYK